MPGRSSPSRRRLQVEWLEARDLLSTAPIPSLLVRLKPEADTALPELRRLTATASTSLQTTAIAGLYEVRGEEAQLSRLLTDLLHHPLVEYAERDAVLEPQRVPNDPSFVAGEQYALDGEFGIRAPPAWDVATGSTSVVVAVIDSGIDYDHPDLYLNIWLNQGEIPAVRRGNLTDTDGDGRITFWDLNTPINQGVGKISDVNADGRISGSDLLAPFNADGTGGWANGLDEDGDGLSDDLVGPDFGDGDNNPADVTGHGTSVAGIIGAVGDNSLGITGVSWKVQLMPLKITIGSTGSGSGLAMAYAVRYAADHGARISNNSYGQADVFSQTQYGAVQHAASRNMLFVAAAGNVASDTDVAPFYPAGFEVDNVISVASTTSTGGLSTFSGYGLLSVDLGAPGENIRGTERGGSIASYTGTSVAAPHVAGVAALLLTANPTWTTAQLKDRILTTATPTASLSGTTVTAGILNAQAALQGTTAVDLSWVSGGLTGPTGALPGSPFTVNRGYTVSGSEAASNFTIGYYRSTDTIIGNEDDVFLTSETISAAGDGSIGRHPGSSPNLSISEPGSYYVFARLDSGLGIGERNEDNNWTRTPQPVVVGTLRVTSFTQTNSGFVAQFNLPIDPAVLNLYSGPDPADVTFTDGEGNPVRGSLVLNATATQVTFIRTGGYFVTSTTPAPIVLRSGATGFRTPGGALLDGNADGIPGDDYLTSIAAPPQAVDTVLSVPDFTRGPGQSIILPLQLSNGAGVTTVILDLTYDPSLLTISAIALGTGVPANAVTNVNVFTPGIATISFASPTALNAGPSDFLILNVIVPSTAPYGAKGILDIHQLVINGNGLTSLADDGLYVIAFPGDTTGNAGYSSTDAQRALRVAVGLDSGFAAFPLIDPRLLADVNRNGRIDAGDATRILQEAVGIDRPEVPLLPSNPPTTFHSGPDPLLRFPKNFRAQPGETITVPLLLEPANGLESADLVIAYDASRLELLDVRRGSLTSDFDLFLPHSDPSQGTLRVGLARSAGPISARQRGSVLLLTFRVKVNAPAGAAVINLMRNLGTTRTQLNEGGLDLVPDPGNEAGDRLDGLIIVRKPRRSAAGLLRANTVR